MGIIDWLIVAVCMAGLSIFTFRAVRLMKGVSDFLTAGRSAGRFMQSFASGMAGIGAVSLVAMFEMTYEAGFPPVWWQMMFWPIGLFLVLSGWVFYRFRETRCMTMAQLFEVRYSKKFRIYSGLIIWASGALNFGIFPAVASRFIVYFCDLPRTFGLMGFDIPTFAPIMLVTLAIAVAFTNLGGQITVMITDCVQGIFCGVLFLGVVVFLVHKFSWIDISTAITAGSGDQSMINPAKAVDANFGLWFFLIYIFHSFYGYQSWQGSQAYYSSALNPHEQKMAGIVGIWAGLPRTLAFVLIPICAFVFMTLPKYSGQAAVGHETIAAIENSQIAEQVTVPVALGLIFPMGFKGLFCAAIVFFLITTQDTYLHSWGSIFVQDVILPFRKRPFEPKQQIRLLRWSVFGVAAFAFMFSLFYKQNEQVLMFFAITGAVISGTGAVIIGGLYLKWGTTAGAWTAMTVGWIMAVGRIVVKQYEEEIALRSGTVMEAMAWLNGINSQYVWFWIMISCMGSYVLVSLLSYRKPFNLQRMLHRGKYDTAGDHGKAKDASKSVWVKIVGITDEFSRTDRIIAILAVIWNFGWVAIFVVGTIAMLTVGISDGAFARFWKVWVWIHIIIGIPAMLWFVRGGVRDLRRFFARLATLERDERDDGRVVDHRSVVDEDSQ